MCHMCPVAARIPCQRGLLYIYIYIQFCGWLWLSHFAPSIVATCAINITILNSNQCWILLAFYECTKTHQPNGVVWNYGISKSTRFSFVPSSNSLFTWTVGILTGHVYHVTCASVPATRATRGGSSLPQPTSRMWWCSPTPRRGPPSFSSSCALGCLGALRKKWWFLGRKNVIIETWNRQLKTPVVCHNSMSTHLQEQLHLGSYMVIYGDITCWSVKYFWKLL